MANLNSTTKKEPDKYEIFLKAFRENKGSVPVACTKSGLSQTEAYIFLGKMAQETNENKGKDKTTLSDSGTKEERVFALLTKMEQLNENDSAKDAEIYLRYSQEYSKLMGHYDNNVDVGYLEELTALCDKLKTVFPDKVLANIAYEIEELTEIQGGIIVEDEEDIYEIS